ncbi:hypothetical protein BC829DRAFT_168729 [Chytridium lagenaria]|nr:hypothetical protein BC829DRAFT_168729 [Chytridium lagenaria]
MEDSHANCTAVAELNSPTYSGLVKGTGSNSSSGSFRRQRRLSTDSARAFPHPPHLPRIDSAGSGDVEGSKELGPTGHSKLNIVLSPEDVAILPELVLNSDLPSSLLHNETESPILTDPFVVNHAVSRYPQDLHPHEELNPHGTKEVSTKKPLIEPEIIKSASDTSQHRSEKDQLCCFAFLFNRKSRNKVSG